MALTELEVEELETILGILGENMTKLKGRSVDFVQDTQKRYDEYGADTRMSVKQWDWLRNLRDQVAK